MKRIYETSGYISDNLTHWVGQGLEVSKSFDILTKIIKTRELKFGESLIYENNNKETGIYTKIGQKMICFTDTPIEQSHAHQKKYSCFGISFNKEKLIPYGAHPVFYILEKHIDFIKFVDDLIDGYRYNHQTDYIKPWLGSFFQPYDTNKNKGFPEYFEREWRISRVLPSRYKEQFKKCNGKIIEHNFKGVIRREEKDKCENDDFFLKFEKDDINSIIVLEGYEEQMETLLSNLDIKCELICLIKDK